MVTSKNIMHEFADLSHFFIEVFQEQTLLVVIKSTAHIWWCDKSRNMNQNEKKIKRNHRVLTGHWTMVSLEENSENEITFLASKYIIDQKTSPYWSVLFVYKYNSTYRICREVIRRNYLVKDGHFKEETKNVLFEIVESAHLTNPVSLYSPCGRLCMIALNFSMKKTRIILAHIVDQNFYIQHLSTELEFLSENESVKCIDFTYQGSY